MTLEKYLLFGDSFIAKSVPTPRALDKCGLSPHLRGSGANGGFGAWWLCPPIRPAAYASC
jgi:hypothetical protein